MYVFRLGVLSFLLSECLVSGFTTGAAFHVFTSQVKDLLGIEIKRNDGIFEFTKVNKLSCLLQLFKSWSSLPIQTYIEIFQQINTINVIAVLISAITIFILMFNNEFLKPRMAKKTALPIPIELIIVVSGTLLSRYLQMKENWQIVPVGHIPLGKLSILRKLF